MRTTLESGAWVEHTPIQEVKGKHIRAMSRVGKVKVTRDAVDDDGQVDVGILVESMDLGEQQEARHDALWALFIAAWSYDAPPPVLDRAAGIVSGTEGMDEIPAADYRAIDALLEPFGAKLSAKPDPKETTTSTSSGSSRGSGGRGSRRG